MSTIHSDSIPNYITAGSLMGLRRAMLLNNAKRGAQFQYFDIQQATVKGKSVWVAWFYDGINNQALKDLETEE